MQHVFKNLEKQFILIVLLKPPAQIHRHRSRHRSRRQLLQLFPHSLLMLLSRSEIEVRRENSVISRERLLISLFCLLVPLYQSEVIGG
jgi:hypothetical protein